MPDTEQVLQPETSADPIAGGRRRSRRVVVFAVVVLVLVLGAIGVGWRATRSSSTAPAAQPGDGFTPQIVCATTTATPSREVHPGRGPCRRDLHRVVPASGACLESLDHAREVMRRFISGLMPMDAADRARLNDALHRISLTCDVKTQADFTRAEIEPWQTRQIG